MRRSLPVLLGTALAMSLVLAALPAQAGTQAEPEISDPEGDEVIAGALPDVLCLDTPAPLPGVCAGGMADIHQGWVTETADELQFRMNMETDAASGKVYGTGNVAFHFSIAGVDYTAGADVDWSDLTTIGGLGLEVPGTGAFTPTGVTASAATEEGGIIVLTVLRSSLADPGQGVVISGLYAEAAQHIAILGDVSISDRAPDSGFGTDYVLTQGAGAVDPDDTDGDGLLDAWETTYFGNLTATDGTGDFDGDGLSDAQEHAWPKNDTLDPSELDPTNPDTDGDGISDGDEATAGTDPLNADDPGETVDPNDTDGDGLNDTWEQDHFGDLDEDGSGDPDVDGLNNTEEQLHGTDPNEADTDGDGIDDGQEIADGTDPLDPNDPHDRSGTDDPSNGACGDIGSHMMADGTIMCNDGSTPEAGGDDDDADGESTDKSFGEKLKDEFKADPGYAAISGGGMLAVVTISLIGLFVRWGL